MCLIHLLRYFRYVVRVMPRTLVWSMNFIARSGLLILSALVIFALFEVRYDTLRRRDKDTVSLKGQSTAFFRV